MNYKLMMLLASRMLDMAQDEFSNHGCNDLPREICELITEDMLEDMRQLNSKGKDPWPEKSHNVGDSSLMWYLSEKLKQMSIEVDRDLKLNKIL